MDIVGLGTPFGLAFASGLNAYLPLLAFTISVRWLHLYKVNPNFAFITSNWFIGVLVVLTILDFVADKIPLIDHAWNAIHTVIRPIAGALVAAASSNALAGGIHIPATTSEHGSESMRVALSIVPVTGIVVLITIIGAALAAFSHVTKSTTRIVSTITTAGFLNIGLSVLEDGLVVIIVLLSLFASTIMFILLILLILFLVPRLIQARNSWSRWRNSLPGRRKRSPYN
jgi:Domain of unknown function (DUF4126)